MARFAYKNSLGAGWSLSFLDNEGSSSTPGFLGVLYHANTAERTYTFPDKSGTIPTTADVTDKVMTTLGDLIIGGTNGAETRLPGPTSAVMYVLTSTGTGSAAQAPAWGQVVGTGQIIANINPTLKSNNDTPALYTQNFVGSSTSTPPVSMYTARGTSGSPTALGNNDVYGGFSCAGRGTTGSVSDIAGIYIRTTQAWTDAAMGSRMEFRIPAHDTNYADTPLVLDGYGSSIWATWLLHTRISDDNWASIRIENGTDPLSPQSGDLWNSGGALKYYNGFDTIDLTAGLLNPMTTLGDIITGGASGAVSRLAGNTTTTPQFLKSLGSAGLATAPSWAQISASDLSDGVSGTGSLVKVQGPTFSGAKVTMPPTAAGYASLNVAPGTVPSSPVSGDIWNVSGDLYFRGTSATQKLMANPMTTLGDLATGGASGVSARLAGNTTTTPQFLRSLGSGGLATAPTWAQIGAADLSDGVSGTGNLVKVQGPTFSGAKANFPASAAGYASINLGSGVAVTSPVSGDVWNEGGKLRWYNGSAVQALSDNLTTQTGNGATSVNPVGATTARINLTGPATLNMAAGGYDGQRLTLELVQDATGGRTVALGTGFAWGADITSFTATTTPSKVDYIGLIYNQTASVWRVVAISKGY